MSNTALFLVPALIWGSTWHAITWQLGTVAEEVSVTYRFAAAPRDGEAIPAAASRRR